MPKNYKLIIYDKYIKEKIKRYKKNKKKNIKRKTKKETTQKVYIYTIYGSLNQCYECNINIDKKNIITEYNCQKDVYINEYHNCYNCYKFNSKDYNEAFGITIIKDIKEFIRNKNIKYV